MNRTAHIQSDKGLGRLGALIFIFLLVACVFVGSQVFPFFYYYHELQGLMQAQADKASEFTDKEIREQLMLKIKKLEIPIDEPEDLKINRFNDKIVIELEYQELLYLDLGEDNVYDLWTFDFHPRAEQTVKTR